MGDGEAKLLPYNSDKVHDSRNSWHECCLYCWDREVSGVCQGVLTTRKTKMEEFEITFHNKAEIRVQAQIFTGRMLVSSGVAAPGGVCILPAKTTHYDIFLKNGATGWEIARKIDVDAKVLTLSQKKGRYVIT